MSRFLTRLPTALYVLAALFFAWSLLNSYWEFRLTNFTGSDSSMVTLMKSKALFQAALDSAYLVANGALLQLLILFNRKEKSA